MLNLINNCKYMKNYSNICIIYSYEKFFCRIYLNMQIDFFSHENFEGTIFLPNPDDSCDIIQKPTVVYFPAYTKKKN